MPRPGPRRPMVGFKLDEDLIAEVDKRAQEEDLIGPKGEPNRSEWIRFALSYSLDHMPRGWRPTAKEDR